LQLLNLCYISCRDFHRRFSSLSFQYRRISLWESRDTQEPVTPVKQVLQSLIEEALEQYGMQHNENLREATRKSVVADQQVLVQKCLAQAWHTLSTEKIDVVVNSFRTVEF